MSKTKVYNFNRSHTKQQLPNINAKTPRSGLLRQPKSYLNQITKQISGNIQYDQMDRLHLTKQQRKLKDILKKMNDDTVRIISDYTPRAKKAHSHVKTATTILAINEKQVQNNNKILSQCQNEIQKLKERAQGLNMQGKSTYEQYIGKIREQILLLQQQNRSIRVQNQRRGKSIINEERIIQDGLIQKVQNDVFLAEHKTSNIRAQYNRVEQEIKQYERKLKQINSKWIQADKYFKQMQKNKKQKDSIKNNEVELANKKTLMQSMKKKNQYYNQNCQFKYYHLLRQLDNCNNSVNEIQQKIQKNFVTTEATKMIIGKLQSQLKSIKERKRQREQQVNQFLNKTKTYSAINKQEGNILNSYGKQLPSQIFMKKDLSRENQEFQIINTLIQNKKQAYQQQSNPQKTDKQILQINNKQQRKDIILNQQQVVQ